MTVKKRIVLFLTAAVLLLSSFSLVFVSAVTEGDITAEIQAKDKEMKELEQSIRSLNSELKEAEATQKTLTGEISALQSEIADLNKQIAPLEASISDLEKKSDDLSAQIGDNNGKVSTLEAEIKDCEAAISDAEGIYNENRESLKQLMRATYESGAFDPVTGINILLDSTSLSSYLAKVDAVAQLTDTVKTQMDEYQKAIEDKTEYKNTLEAKKNELSAVITVLEGDRAEYDENVRTLEGEKNTLDTKKASLEKSQKSLEKKLAENKTLQEKINKTINDKQKLLKKYQDEIKKLNDELEKLIQGSGGTVSEDDFIWPLSKRFVITTYYLDKEYYKDFGIWHYAIDVGGSGINKSPVYASKSGTVKQSAYQAGGAGHYVIIDHGDNQLTVYYHLTSRAVNKGDKVKQGQTIGTVGSTGNSTGPHLHFGIKINGSWVDPLKYVVNRP